MVQSMLAEMYVLVETMRTFTYRTLAAAAAVEIGEGGRGDIHKLTAASVMYAADSVHTVLDKAMQIHGGSAISGSPRSTGCTARSSCSRSAPARPKCAR